MCIISCIYFLVNTPFLLFCLTKTRLLMQASKHNAPILLAFSRSGAKTPGPD